MRARSTVALLAALIPTTLAARAHADGFGPSDVWHDWIAADVREAPRVGDVNGDGKSDVVVFQRDAASGDVLVYPSSGSMFGAAQKWHDWFGIGQETPVLGDFDGDGADDIATFIQATASGGAQGDVYVSLSTRSSFGPASLWHGWFAAGAAEVPLAGDFDGDGKDDIVTFVRDAWGTGDARGDVWVSLSTGSSFAPATRWHDYFCVSTEVPKVGDFNGDGRDDIACFVRDTWGTGAARGDVYVALSTGTKFGTPKLAHDYFSVGDEEPMVGDWNGDGCADVATAVRTSATGSAQGDVWVAMAKCGFSAPAPGTLAIHWFTGFAGSLVWHDDFAVARTRLDYGWFGSINYTNAALPMTGDFNGDGLGDLVAFAGAASLLGDTPGDATVALNAAPSQAEAGAEQFGYGAMKVNGKAAAGTRPLMVLLIEFSDQSIRAPRRATAWWSSLFFGATAPTVSGYFTEVSKGKFTFTSAGVYGPYAMQDDTSTTTQDESKRTCYFAGGCKDAKGNPWNDVTFRGAAVRRAAAAGVDFSVYDTNADGTVTGDELVIYVVDATPANVLGGATRNVCESTTNARGVTTKVCLKAAGGAEGTNFETLTHELTHTLGAIDLYSGGCLSQNATLMSCTIPAAGEDQRKSLHLDAWHKMQLGWLRPRIYPITAPGSCRTMDAAQRGGAFSAGNPDPVLLYDPRRGNTEYFLLEYRDPTAGTGGRYDDDVVDTGVAVWHVKQNADLTAAQVPSLRLLAGPNGVIDSTRSGDDVALDTNGDGRTDLIVAGPDDVLQSSASGDDVRPNDNGVWVDGGANGIRGSGNFLAAAEGAWILRWIDRAEAQVAIDTEVNPWVPAQGFLRWAWYGFNVLPVLWAIEDYDVRECYDRFI